jgi:hypothetical protein
MARMRLTRFARHWPKWALRLCACRAATISGATTVVWRAPFLTDGGDGWRWGELCDETSLYDHDFHTPDPVERDATPSLADAGILPLEMRLAARTPVPLVVQVGHIGRNFPRWS